MAKTYTASAVGATFASNKSLLALYNGSANRYVYLQKVWVLGNNTTAIVGCLTQLILRRITALSGGVAVVPVAHDSANSSSNLTGITCVTGGAFTHHAHGPIVTTMWNNDEAVVSATGTEEVQLWLPCFLLNYQTDFGPIFLPQGHGVHLVQPGINRDGLVDVFFEFTVETV